MIAYKIVERTKKAWLYGGLALAEGVGLVSTPEASEHPPFQLGGSVVLFGDELALGLGTPFRELCEMDWLGLEVSGRRGSKPSEWLDRGWAKKLGGRPAPTLFLGAFQWPSSAPDAAMRAIEHVVEASGPVLWLAPPWAAEASRAMELRQRPPHGVFCADALDIPLGPDGRQPTAMGYAGWAGALWKWLA